MMCGTHLNKTLKTPLASEKALAQVPGNVGNGGLFNFHLSTFNSRQTWA
jgi:hypothetical protein